MDGETEAGSVFGRSRSDGGDEGRFGQSAELLDDLLARGAATLAPLSQS